MASELVYNSTGHICGEGCGCPTTNAYNATDSHGASQVAGRATMASGHTRAMKHAAAAVSAARNGDSDAASAHHLRAAKVHESAAEADFKNNFSAEAQKHWDSAAAHRKASSMHAATVPYASDSDEADNSRELSAVAVDPPAAARGESLGKIPGGQGRGDILAANVTHNDYDSVKSRIEEFGFRGSALLPIEQEVRIRNRVDEIIVPGKAPVVNQGPRTVRDRGVPGVMEGIIANASDHLNPVSPALRVKSVRRDESELSQRDDFYGGSELDGDAEEDSPSFDGRRRTRETRTVGMVPGLASEQEIHPASRFVEVGVGHEDSDATAAAKTGFTNDEDSEESLRRYAALFARNQAIVQNTERLNNSLTPLGAESRGGRPADPHWGQLQLTLNDGHGGSGVSASMAKYMGLKL